MAANRIQLKRTSTPGRTPNTTNSANSQFIDVGELALNLADGVLYTSNGSALINLTPAASVVNVAAQFTWTNTQTFSNTITFSSTINGTANNALYLGTVAAASYVQNTDSRTLSGNLYFTGANSYFGGKTTLAANLVLNTGISIIDSTGSQGTAGQVLTSNGTSNVYWSTVSSSAASSNATSAIYTGDGVTANFTLPAAVANLNNIIVTLNGLVQTPATHYTVSGTTLSFTSAPYNTSLVEARNFEGTAGSTGSGGSGSTISSGDLFLGAMLLGGM
jgi:hypothetical protein